MPRAQAPEVVIYRTHFVNALVRRELDRLRAELADDKLVDIVVAGYAPRPLPLDFGPHRSVIYGREDLARLPYRSKLLFTDWQVPTGENDLPVLRLFHDAPHYAYYWVVEYDVRYTGNWRALFDELRDSDADLLATTLQNFAEHPLFVFWPTLFSSGGWIPDELMTKGFLPFCRLSRAALAAIHADYASGVGGHYEVTWPTICRRHGLRIEDLGGIGSYTPARWHNRHYSNTRLHWTGYPGTFVYRPSFSDRDIGFYGKYLTDGAMLWHPVKS